MFLSIVILEGITINRPIFFPSRVTRIFLPGEAGTALNGAAFLNGNAFGDNPGGDAVVE